MSITFDTVRELRRIPGDTLAAYRVAGLRGVIDEARRRARSLPDAVAADVAWLLPRRLAYWATFRVGAAAMTGQHSHQVVPELLFVDALKRWSPNE
jgi:hypothetical protein